MFHEDSILDDSTTFDEQLKKALKNYADPRWLGQHSSLATPYFLSEATEEILDTASPLRRGQALQMMLWRAAEVLWGVSLPPGSSQGQTREEIRQGVYEEEQKTGKGSRYFFLVLELRYFRHYFQLPKLEMIWEDVLLVSKAQFYKDLAKAEQKLGEILLTHIRPPFFLEQPVVPATFVGRETIQQQCVNALAEYKTVAINGAGGIGKTTLGAAIAEQWPTRAVFWYTVRPNLNGRLSNMLFSLGHFLQRWGASALWKQLVADKGEVKNLGIALKLVQYDLDRISHTIPLLCLDETDSLCPADPEKDSKELAQLREFLQSLRGQIAMLILGQRTTLGADVQYVLNGLTVVEMIKWLNQSGVPCSSDDLTRLYNHTGGNPRLITLSMALHQGENTFTTVLDRLPKTSILQSMLGHLWQRLSDDQHYLLQFLSVFRTPAPEDAWEVKQTTLNSLIERQLVQRNRHGGIFLSPVLQEIIYRELSAEQREERHRKAATIRAVRGEYTAALYHYVQSGDIETAVWLWGLHHEQEIQRGQGPAALDVLRQISLSRLSEEGRKTLVFLRSNLYRLTGEADKALADLKAVEIWPPQSKPAIHLLQGNFLDILGYSDDALSAYGDGLEATVQLLNKQTQLHTQRGMVYVRQRKMKQAWAEACRARYDAENLQGVVRSGLGNYEAARSHYQTALEIAQEIEYVDGMAYTHANLANLGGRRGDIEVAAAHSEKAIHYYEQIGFLYKKEQVRSNLAAMYIQAKRYQEAIEPAVATLAFARSIKSPYFIAVSATNLAEAYLGVGQPEPAQEFADLALAQNEPQSAPYAWYILGQVARKKGELAKAEQCHQKAIMLTEQNEDRYMGAYAWKALGEVLLEEGRVEEGQQALKKALRWFEELQIQEAVVEINTLLAGFPETLQFPGN